MQTLLPQQDKEDRFSPVAKAGGFSLHAGVAVRPHDRKKLEHLCRYVAKRGKGARNTTHSHTEPDDRNPMEERAADVGPGTDGLTNKKTDIMDDAATGIAG